MSEQPGTREVYILNNHSEVFRYSAEESNKTNLIIVPSPV